MLPTQPITAGFWMARNGVQGLFCAASIWRGRVPRRVKRFTSATDFRFFPVSDRMAAIRLRSVRGQEETLTLNGGTIHNH